MADLTSLTATALARGIRTGELSSREAVDAHIDRLAVVEPHLNALCIERFEAARREADAADAAVRAGGPLGPLHGVPMTVKEQFLLEGTATTMGLPHLADWRAPADGPLVGRLRAAGAVVLGKTNVAQLLFYVESDNPVWGRTNNPWDLERTPGGSTGGEAALIAAEASPLGIGGDIGGSIREPAAFCGIAGLKPTSNRLTNLDTRGGIFPGGQGAIVAQPGPMARSVADLVVAMEVLAAPGLERLDATVVPASWRDPAAVDVAGLRVGLVTDDGWFPPSAALRRVVEDAGAGLRAAGAHVEAWTPPDVGEAMRLFFGILTADGMTSAWRALGPDAPEPQLRLYLDACALDPVARKDRVAALRAAGHAHMAALVDAVGPRSAESYWDLVEAQGAYRSRFLAELDARGIDVLVTPPAALPALRHGDTAVLPDYDSYARVFNVLGMPAGVVPAGRVQPHEADGRAEPVDGVLAAAARVDQGSAGLPVGVQVAGRHWREDQVLATMAALEAHFRTRDDYPAWDGRF